MSDLIISSRRKFLCGLGAASLVAVAAPAVVRAASLMPVRAQRVITFEEYWLRAIEPVLKRLRQEIADQILSAEGTDLISLLSARIPSRYMASPGELHAVVTVAKP